MSVIRPLKNLLFAAAILASPLPAQTVTYSEHIAPIIYNNCSKCHRPGQVAPFSLLSYSDARQRGRTIATATQSRYMPPWKPEPGWAAYRDERHLSNDQIALIQKWVDGGMPEGDPAKAPPVPAFADGWQLGTPDLILEMPQAFAVPAVGEDIYRNFVIPTSLSEDKWVRAIEFRPAARTVVHHSLFFTDTTGAARAQNGKDGLPGFPGFGSIFTVAGTSSLNGGLGGWVPGTTPAFLPDGIALALPKGADFLLQTHFHSDGVARSEKSVIGLYFGPKPTREMTQLQVPAFFGVRANIDIPKGDPAYKVRGSFTLPTDVDAVGVYAHAHYLAKESKLTATLPNGEVRILLWIKQWDFNWQDQYLFKDLVALPAGTRLDGELTYDNSDSNPRNPNRPAIRVKWGEGSTDEMGSLLLNVVPKVAADISNLRNVSLLYILAPVPLVGSKPFFVSSGLVDAASTLGGAVTPGKIMVLYGSGLGPASLTKAPVLGDGKLATTAGGTQVLFNGIAAPLIYTSSGQLGAVVPYGIDGKSGVQVQVKVGNLTSDSVALPVAAAAPSIFSVDQTGAGQGAIVNQDGLTVNSPSKPARPGDIVSIYATGEGQTSPAGTDGLMATKVLPKPLASRPVRVLINGKEAQVVYAGAAPEAVAGLFQVNAKIPNDTPAGANALEIRVGDAASQPGPTISVGP